MKSDESRLKTTALYWTVAVCMIVEVLAVFVLRAVVGSWGGAVVLSVLLLGPLSLWIARPIYLYWLKAGR